MFVVDLICAESHLFEGWYDNRDAFDEAKDAGTLSCPVCNSHDVELRPSFRGIVMGGSSTTATTTTTPAPATPPKLPLELQRALSDFIKVVKAHSEDAGEHFARRALAMHKGDEVPAPIYGTSTPDERQQLRDEGVDFLAVPVPEIDQN
ncbi:MAG TPA: DUF1178 family protein [Myxococcota bacterium]